MVFSSQLIEDAVKAFSSLPGIGKKTALRLVLHLLKEEEESVGQFAAAITKMRAETQFCKQCYNIADSDLCTFCNDKARNQQIICVVEGIRDVISIESTQQYHGLYHVLGGLLSPLDGIGPDQLHMQQLRERIEKEQVAEVVLALSPTIEGDTTMYYISKLLQGMNVPISSIARGISFGTDLEYTDELTLARSINKRLPISTYINMDS